MWDKIKREFQERFFTFEAFNGGFIHIPWGIGFIYYGIPWTASSETFLYIITQPQFGYNYALLSTGAVQIVWGVRKLTVNRVKQAAKMEELVEQRREDDAVKS